MRYLIFFIFYFLPNFGFSHLEAQGLGDPLHFRFAFTADLGSHFQRAGVLFQLGHSSNHLEISHAVEFKFALKGYGPQKKKGEIIFHLGAAFSHKTQEEEELNGQYLPFHFFKRSTDKFQYGYTFNYYLDPSSTSQGTGTISLKFGDTYLISENDLLGNFKGKDQFRTGAIGLFRTEGNLILGIKSMLWTGQTRCATMTKVRESDYPARYGYKNIKDCKYANLSHGLLSLESSYVFGNAWIPSLSIGKDDERIRNLVQNKFIHDMKFIPAKLSTAHNAHLPMLDTNGQAYLYKDDQQIKKGKWFVQMGLNHGWFY